jgi:hypothetical protein
LLQTETPIEVADLIVFDGKERVRLAGVGSHDQPVVRPSEGDWWLLSAHYAEQDLAPISIPDPCRCEHYEWDRTCETVRYSLRRTSLEKCCQHFECELECDCKTSRCEEPGNPRKGETPARRGGKHCLCEHLIGLARDIVPGSECGTLCPLEESCGRVRVDLGSAVPIACVQLVPDDCGRWLFGAVEACGPRRLVKRNDLLFDLIRGCDLTRISEISWHEWHRSLVPVSFHEFSEFLGPNDSKGLHEYVTNFVVTFSRSVVEDTLRPDCFAMTVLSAETEGGWWQIYRVPIVRLEPLSRDPKRGDCVGAAAMVVDGAWVEDAVRGRRSIFLAGETRVEIEVRGDFILDCNGQSVDASTVGLLPAPTGNGTPGGTFLSTFRVARAEPSPRPAREVNEEQ